MQLSTQATTRKVGKTLDQGGFLKYGYAEEELDEMATVAFFATVHNDDASRISLIMRQLNCAFSLGQPIL